MANTLDMLDIFDTDVAGVVKELCSPKHEWAKKADTLKQKIEEHEVDGRTLLKFGKLCGDDELRRCLGIDIAHHSVLFMELLVTLRANSKGYKKWYEGHENQVFAAMGNHHLDTRVIF